MNLNIWQVLFLALLQGVTELFPISSLGHTVIIPSLLGWGDLVRDKNFLPLIVALHLGTSIALVIYFWRVWLQVLRSIVKTVKDGEVKRGTEEWVSFLIIIGCIPGGLLGVFLETQLSGQSMTVWLYVLLGMVVACVAAYLSTKFLLKYFETGRLYPFAYYCWAVGLLALFLLLVLHV